MDRRLERILKQHVMTDALLGVEAVPVGDAEFEFEEAAPTQRAAEAAVIVPQRPVEPAHPAATPALSIPPTPLFHARRADGGAVKKLFRADKVRLLAEASAVVAACTRCGLCQARTQTVFGEGDPNAQVMFIGEGPGETEDQTGRPFVGRAGELLDKQITAMGMKREQVYIANVVKCRPPGNRTPTPVEAQTCYDFLRQQIATIQPRVIVTLGGPAAKTILSTQTGITALRGTWGRYDGLVSQGGPSIPVMPTFHPAYLLRSYTEENRRKVWSDLKKVMEQLKSPE